jgi:hypothetical protein
MSAPEKFCNWLKAHEHIDRLLGHKYRYHSRSDAHSIALCKFIGEDLLASSPLLRDQALLGKVAYGINIPYLWPNGKRKAIDLAIGLPKKLSAESDIFGIQRALELTDVFVSCEAKTVMTEHKKSQPRVFDELSSSHEIVHQGNPQAIAAGITVVNISKTFVSPLRQKAADSVFVSPHRQPQVTESMVNHLRGLPIRNETSQVGFDAYSTLVINCDNVHVAELWTDPPAPQPGDPDHYDAFVRNIVRAYVDRFSQI